MKLLLISYYSILLLLPIGCTTMPQNVVIKYGEVGEAKEGFETAAECHPATWQQKQAVIVINKSVWLRLSVHMRELLVKHEIGHCVYGLKHTEEGYMRPVLD